MLDYYDLLGVAADSSRQEIQSSYRQRIRTLHPDRFTEDANGLAMARQMSGLLNIAWETLSRPDARADYDSQLRHDDTPDLAATDRGTSDGRLLEVLGDALRRVARTSRASDDRDELAELSRPLLVAAMRYRAAPGQFGDAADALAVAAAWRDVSADGSLGPRERSILARIAGTAVDLLGAPLSLQSRSWLERGVRPAIPASVRHQVAQAVSRAGVALVALAAVGTGIDLHAGRGVPWVPLVAGGAAPTPRVAVVGTVLVVALALALVTLVASRLLGAGSRAEVPAEPTVSVHLDAVDRIRFAAGRRFRSLPDREPPLEPTDI